MDNEQEAPPARVVEISLKYFIALVTTFVTALGSVVVAYYNYKPDDSDRFYGSQGRANTNAIKQIREVDKNLKIIIEDYARTKPMMLQRMKSVEAYQAAREIEFNQHVAWGNERLRKTSVENAEMRMQLNECMRRLP